MIAASFRRGPRGGRPYPHTSIASAPCLWGQTRHPCRGRRTRQRSQSAPGNRSGSDGAHPPAAHQRLRGDPPFGRRLRPIAGLAGRRLHLRRPRGGRHGCRARIAGRAGIQVENRPAGLALRTHEVVRLFPAPGRGPFHAAVGAGAAQQPPPGHGGVVPEPRVVGGGPRVDGPAAVPHAVVDQPAYARRHPGAGKGAANGEPVDVEAVLRPGEQHHRGAKDRRVR
jgi:hypothetical protein